MFLCWKGGMHIQLEQTKNMYKNSRINILDTTTQLLSKLSTQFRLSAEGNTLGHGAFSLACLNVCLARHILTPICNLHIWFK
jgi:hypothetical protein